MSTSKTKEERFSSLRVRKNERPDELPVAILDDSTSTQETNVGDNYKVDTSDIETRGRKKIDRPSYRRVTFNVEQNLHRDFKIMSANLGVSMVDMLDEALRLYMEIRNQKDLHDKFRSGKTVTDIVFESISNQR